MAVGDDRPTSSTAPPVRSPHRVCLDQEGGGLFEHVLDGLEELGGHGAVDEAVVAAHGHAHDGADAEGLFASRVGIDDGLIDGGADGEDGSVRWVDDGSEVVDAEHA